MADCSRLQRFWDETARIFRDRGKYSPVLYPSSRGLLNFYTDFLQRTALNKVLEERKAERLLDVGCGVGRWSMRAAAGGKEVVGIDFARQMVRIAKDRTKEMEMCGRADYIVAAAQALPFVSEYFRTALSVTVLQHIVDAHDLQQACTELVRVVSPEGRIILLELAHHKKKRRANQFPTVSHPYEKIFPKTETSLTCIHSVDLQLFLMPFMWALERFGRYIEYLSAPENCTGTQRGKTVFYALASIAAIFSLPFDLCFRNRLPAKSTHIVFVFHKKP